ncbi:MAG: MFS transporter [Actinomycetota bacterium]
MIEQKAPREATPITAGPVRAGGGSALRHRAFRRFWTGALFSNMGTWMQNVTVPYVVYQVTHRAIWVGVAAFAGLFPSVVLAPWSGWLADRLDRRKLLLAGQVLQAAAAAALWAAWVSGYRHPGAIMGLLLINGLSFAATMPAWQAFITQLVPRRDLLSAISLNSAQFNAARAVGPAVAGVVLARFGPSWAFLVNALSYLAVIGALAVVRPQSVERPTGRRRPLRDFGEAIAYSWRSPTLRLSMALIAAVFFFGNPVFQLTAVFADRVYRVGPGLFGLLGASYGTGAVLGSVALGAASRKWPRSRITPAAILAFALGLGGLGTFRAYAAGIFFLLICGAAFLASVATLNTTVQLTVPERIRGRVLAIYLMGLTGSFPLGALVQGRLADTLGAPATVLIAAAGLLVVWAVLSSRGEMAKRLDVPDHPIEVHADEAVPA